MNRKRWWLCGLGIVLGGANLIAGIVPTANAELANTGTLFNDGAGNYACICTPKNCQPCGDVVIPDET